MIEHLVHTVVLQFNIFTKQHPRYEGQRGQHGALFPRSLIPLVKELLRYKCSIKHKQPHIYGEPEDDQRAHQGYEDPATRQAVSRSGRRSREGQAATAEQL